MVPTLVAMHYVVDLEDLSPNNYVRSAGTLASGPRSGTDSFESAIALMSADRQVQPMLAALPVDPCHLNGLLSIFLRQDLLAQSALRTTCYSRAVNTIAVSV